jgi:hypothetical protein
MLNDPAGHACRAFLNIYATTEEVAYRPVRQADGLSRGSIEGQETGARAQEKGSSIHRVHSRGA